LLAPTRAEQEVGLTSPINLVDDGVLGWSLFSAGLKVDGGESKIQGWGPYRASYRSPGHAPDIRSILVCVDGILAPGRGNSPGGESRAIQARCLVIHANFSNQVEEAILD